MFSGVSRKPSRTFQATDVAYGAQPPFPAAWSGEAMEPGTSSYVGGREKADAADHSLHSLSLQAQGPPDASQLNASHSQASGPEHLLTCCTVLARSDSSYLEPGWEAQHPPQAA